MKNCPSTQKAAAAVAAFYDRHKCGHQGPEGYRKSTDLGKMLGCVNEMVQRDFLQPGETVFLDLGSGDGRVNVLMSYFVRYSLGVEVDPAILDEYPARLRQVKRLLADHQLLQPPDNILILEGDALGSAVYRQMQALCGVEFADVDLFYTYICLHDLYAAKICREAKAGALYLVFGFNTVLPRYQGLELVAADVGGGAMAALYRKK